MIDILYIGIAFVFFLITGLLLKICDVLFPKDLGDRL
jgi:hypothetical protein